MNRDEIKRMVCTFLDTVATTDVSTFETDESIAFEDSGLIDSLSMLEIVAFLEDQFGIDFSHIGIDPEYLGSISRILKLIDSAGA